MVVKEESEKIKFGSQKACMPISSETLVVRRQKPASQARCITFCVHLIIIR